MTTCISLSALMGSWFAVAGFTMCVAGLIVYKLGKRNGNKK